MISATLSSYILNFSQVVSYSDSVVHPIFVLAAFHSPAPGPRWPRMFHQVCTQSSRRVGMKHAGVQVWACDLCLVITDILSHPKLEVDNVGLIASANQGYFPLIFFYPGKYYIC